MKLQVGRTYRTRDDRTVEIIDLYEKPGWYRGRTVVTELDTWKENGGYDPEGEESRMDLIEEVSPPLRVEFECEWVADDEGILRPMGKDVKIKAFDGKRTRVTVEEI